MWMRFAQNTLQDEVDRRMWREACNHDPSQENLLSSFSECLMSGSCRWACDVFEGLECRKQHAAGIFVTSKMICDHLHGKPDVKLKWENQVERSWFYDDEPASDFLLRANRFLREQMTHSVCILQTPVRTQSYVAFLRMPRLASLLLFEYLNVRKLEEDSSPAASGRSASTRRAAPTGTCHVARSTRRCRFIGRSSRAPPRRACGSTRPSTPSLSSRTRPTRTRWRRRAVACRTR